MIKPLLIVALTVVVSGARGQIIQSTRFTKGSISDGEKILMAYLLPLERSFNAISSSGFVDFQRNTKNKEFVYSLGVQLVVAVAPASDRTYNVNDLQLSEFGAANPSNAIAQTFAGNSNTVELATNASYKAPTTSFPFYANKPLLKLNSPEGAGTALLGLGFLTAAVYSKGVEISLRIMPPFRVPKTEAIVYSAGGSLQLELNTLIKSMHFMSVKVIGLIGLQYTRLSLDPGLAPESSRTEISLQSDNGPYDNQEFNISSRTIPLELVFQKSLDNFIVYAGAGFNFSKSRTALEGNIPLYQKDPTNTLSIIVEDIENPVAYERQNNTAHLNLGLKYFRNSFGLNAGFNISKYQSFYLGCNVLI